MGVLRIPQHAWEETKNHLFTTPGEHFGFYLAAWTQSDMGTVFLVKDFLPIPDSLVEAGWDGYDLKREGLLRAVNAANFTGNCLIEMHNHGGKNPRFSDVDLDGLDEIKSYMHSSLPERPYGALVWGDNSVYGKYFPPTGTVHDFQSITVFGRRLLQIVSRDDKIKDDSQLYDRQKLWLSNETQNQMANIRVAIVGCGGIGSHVIQQLTYLGCRDFILIDGDQIETSNLNRLIFATYSDVNIPKAIVASQFIKRIAPSAKVAPFHATVSMATNVLKGADVIFGCVDNDGARLILNELSIAYNIPFIDLATGIEVQNGAVSNTGGRVAMVLPDGPCLLCANEIDQTEASFFLANAKEKQQRITRGYFSGLDVQNPAVVSLNGMIASTAVNEFTILLSGIRDVNLFTDLDLLGVGRKIKSQWLTPRSVKRDPNCVQCALQGIGDQTGIQRYKN